MAATEYTLNGFTYWQQRYFVNGFWGADWYFRPVGAEIDVHYLRHSASKTLRVGVETFLSDAAAAVEYYESALARLGDVAAAEANLENAKARHARAQVPDYDPGGNTNNPGRVARVMREDARAVPDAAARLAEARHVAEIIALGNKRAS